MATISSIPVKNMDEVAVVCEQYRRLGSVQK